MLDRPIRTLRIFACGSWLATVGVLAVACSTTPPSARPSPQATAAQVPWCLASKGGSGRVWGSAYDSTTHRPVPDAKVWIQRVNESGAAVNAILGEALTDSLGHYCLRLGSVHVPARYAVFVAEPFDLPRRAPVYRFVGLDSLGVATVDVPWLSPEARAAGPRASMIALIANQRKVWLARRPGRYYLQVRPFCLCPGETQIAIVERDSVVGSLDPTTGQERLGIGGGTTIERLFDRLESEVRVPRNVRFEVAWHPRYGFPIRWDVGPAERVFDIYSGMIVERFEPAER